MENNHFIVEGKLNNYKVKFPYPPYETQKDIISKLIQSFESKGRSLIESPTGTGKTMCCLAAGMSFIEKISENMNYKKEKEEYLKIMRMINLFNEIIKIIKKIDKKFRSKKIPKLDEIEEILSPLKKTQFGIIKEIDLLNEIRNYKWLIQNFNLLNTYFYNFLIENYKNIQILNHLENNIKEQIKGFKDGVKYKFKYLRKIIFAVRTGTQIENIFEEFQNIKQLYPGFIMAVLQSRDVYCLNSSLENLSGVVKNQKCKSLNSKGSCFYKNNSKDMINNYDKSLKYYKELKSCPYYTELNNVFLCDIVLVTYNYLFSKTCRKIYSDQIVNPIIIIDEGHNAISSCETSVSYRFELNEVYNDIIKLFNLFPKKKEKKLKIINSEIKPDEISKFEINVKNFFEEYEIFIETLLSIGFSFYNNLLNLNEDKIYERQIDFEGETIFLIFLSLFNNYNSDFVESSNIDNLDLEEKVKVIEEFYKKYFNYKQNLEDEQEKKNLSFLNDRIILEIMHKFEKFEKNYINLFEQSFPFFSKLFSFYKFFIGKILGNYLDQKKDKKFIKDYYFYQNILDHNSKYEYLKFFSDTPLKMIFDHSKDFLDKYRIEFNKVNIKYSNKFFEFNCLNPAVSYKIMKKDLHPSSINLISGTLSPFEYYISELDENFEYNISTDHIIDLKRVKFLLFTEPIFQDRDLNNFNLTFSYSNMNQIHVKEKVFNCTNEIIKRISEHSKGCLLFFKSYELLEEFKENLSRKEVWSEMNRDNFVKVEKNERWYFDGNSSFQKTGKKHIFHNFKDSCSKNKTFFSTVMRGSFSEGINYTNQESSCVVIIGIPFDNYNNPHCKFKRKYFDKKKEEGEIKINGQKWYEIQAMIYLNQAIGRAIRKKDDYSVVCIIDSQISKLKKNLSKWIDKNILIKVTSGDFENHVEKTKEFYSSFNN